MYIFNYIVTYINLDFYPNDHAHNAEDCAVFYYGHDFTWVDTVCDKTYSLICKKR